MDQQNNAAAATEAGQTSGFVPFMPFSGCTPLTAPDRLQPAGKKDERYHSDMGHALMSSVDGEAINHFRATGFVNARMSSGDQWFFNEDRTTFLADESNQTNTRVMLTVNVMRSTQEKHRSSASKAVYNAEATPVSPLWMTKRDDSRARYLQLHRDAQTGRAMKAAIGSMMPLGNSEFEGSLIHDNTYQDAVTTGVTGLMKMCAAQNGFSNPVKHEEEATSLFRFGATISHFKVHHRHVTEELIDPYDFFWPSSVKRRDFSDASFLGCSTLMSPPQIFERYELSKASRKRLEEAARFNFMPITRNGSSDLTANHTSSAVVQVFSIYWRDVAYCEYGYVKGENGVPELVKVNYIGPDDPPDTKPQYTTEDLIDPPNRPSVQKVFKGNKTRIKTVEVVRFVDMIPWEYLHGGDNTKSKDVSESDRHDLVLDYGLCPFQEHDPLHTSSIKFPIKATAWDIANGRIIAPCTDLVSPQRLLNRTVSISENHIASMPLPTHIVDMDQLHQMENPALIPAKLHRGKTIMASAKGMGAGNVIGTTGNNMGTSLQGLNAIQQNMIAWIRLVGATPEAVTGTPIGEDQAVGVTDRLAFQANLLDEPFRATLKHHNEQKFQLFATAGKDWYVQNADAIYDMVDSDYVKALIASRTASLEQHRVKVTMTSSDESMFREADQLLLGLRQLQLIDDERMMNLMGRCTKADVYKACREFQEAKRLASRELSKEEKKANAAQNLAAADMGLRAQDEKYHDQMVEAAMQKANNADKSRMMYERADAGAKATWLEKPQSAAPATA